MIIKVVWTNIILPTKQIYFHGFRVSIDKPVGVLVHQQYSENVTQTGPTLLHLEMIFSLSPRLTLWLLVSFSKSPTSSFLDAGFLSHCLFSFGHLMESRNTICHLAPVLPPLWQLCLSDKGKTLMRKQFILPRHLSAFLQLFHLLISKSPITWSLGVDLAFPLRSSASSLCLGHLQEMAQYSFSLKELWGKAWIGMEVTVCNWLWLCCALQPRPKLHTQLLKRKLHAVWHKSRFES